MQKLISSTKVFQNDSVYIYTGVSKRLKVNVELTWICGVAIV